MLIIVNHGHAFACRHGLLSIVRVAVDVFATLATILRWVRHAVSDTRLTSRAG